MQPVAVPMSFYGQPTDVAALDWSWVEEQLEHAGTYWIVVPSPRAPHPRPVWGVWLEHQLLLSIGSPVIARALADAREVTVHLDSGTDVVIVEGEVEGTYELEPFLAAYNAKYDWNYTLDEYGPPTAIRPRQILAWRSAGWAGREGFVTAGKWSYRTSA